MINNESLLRWARKCRENWKYISISKTRVKARFYIFPFWRISPFDSHDVHLSVESWRDAYWVFVNTISRALSNNGNYICALNFILSFFAPISVCPPFFVWILQFAKKKKKKRTIWHETRLLIKFAFWSTLILPCYYTGEREKHIFYFFLEKIVSSE